jgi:Flp pilus assembly protein TadG
LIFFNQSVYMAATRNGMKAKGMSLNKIPAEGGTPIRVCLPMGSSQRVRSTILRTVRNARRDRKGAAAAEFALVLPAMMGLLFGTFEYGIAFFSFSAMQSAARDVTRQVAVNTMLAGGAEAAIRARLPTWARDNATVTVLQSAPANPAANVYTVRIAMPMSAATPIQFFSRVANPTLRTELRMKQEMPYVAVR